MKVSLRTAAGLGLNALHECIVPKGAETQISDAMRALRSAIDADLSATQPEGFQARYRIPDGEWSSWGHVVCGVKGHEQELRIAPDRASPSRAAWIDVAARLPEPGKAVLLDIGKKTPIRALWAAKATVEAGDDADDSWVEYDEASGTTYCPEGWYEWNEHEETHWAVSATPLRWMSIPVPAAVDVGAAAPKGGQDEFDAWRQS